MNAQLYEQNEFRFYYTLNKVHLRIHVLLLVGVKLVRNVRVNLSRVAIKSQALLIGPVVSSDED